MNIATSKDVLAYAKDATHSGDNVFFTPEAWYDFISNPEVIELFKSCRTPSLQVTSPMKHAKNVNYRGSFIGTDGVILYFWIGKEEPESSRFSVLMTETGPVNITLEVGQYIKTLQDENKALQKKVDKLELELL